MSVRYQRQEKLPEIGMKGQERLKNSHVLVVGAGGLGCPVLTYLVAAGVGALTIIDNDIISESNLNRQVLYGLSDVGKSKVEVARQRLAAQNAEVKVEVIKSEINLINAQELIKGKDVVVDCTDNMATRYLLSDVSELCSVPLVFGGIHRFQGQITVFNSKNGISYRDLFPYDSQKVQPSSCNENGVLGVVPGVIGIYQAIEVLKIIAGFGDVLDGKMAVVNLKNLQNQIFGIQKEKRDKIQKLVELPEYEHLCFANYSDCISVGEFLKMDFDTLDLVDIRGEEELPKSILKITEEKNCEASNLVLLCQTGKRTRVALQDWKVKYPKKKIYSLEGGVEELNAALIQK